MFETETGSKIEVRRGGGRRGWGRKDEYGPSALLPPVATPLLHHKSIKPIFGLGNIKSLVFLFTV